MALLCGLYLTHEERVVAGRVLLCEAAAEPGHCAFELRRAVGAVSERDSLPEGDGRDAAREVLGDVLLAGSEDADRELLRLAEQLVQRGVAPDREPEERRLELERDERGYRQPGALPAEIDGHDRNSGRNAPHDRSQLVAAHHAAIIRAPNAGAPPAPDP